MPTLPRQPAIVTIDIGLTNCKVSLFGEAGGLLAQEGRPYATISPEPDRSEQDPRAWREAAVACCGALQPALGGVEVLCISVTAHMHGLVALDADLRPLTTCWTLFDRRAEREAAELKAALGEGFAYRATGGRLEAYTPAAKIAWMRRHMPDVFERARLFVSPKDAVRLMLGGAPVTDPIDAAGTLLWNLERREWDAAICEAAGVTSAQLPEVREPWGDAGRLSAAAAQVLGLPEGTPIITGSGDDVEVLGAGVVEPGQTLEHIGTTGTLIVCTDRPLYDPQGRVECYPHPITGRFLVGGATNAAGRSLDWAKRLLGSDAEGRLPLAYPPADDRPTPPLYLPFIKGERGLLWEAFATGAFIGLREEHGPADLAQAVYEGVAFSLKEILVAARRMGAEPTAMVSGTPLSQADWAQLRADMYGMALSFPTAGDLTGLGAAILGLANRGVFADIPEAVRQCSRAGAEVQAGAARSAWYDRAFEAYMAAVEAHRGLFGAINSVR